MTTRSAGTRGVVNDALAVYFLRATIASAFVALVCGAEGRDRGRVYRVREANRGAYRIGQDP
jgi:hypothetical protein